MNRVIILEFHSWCPSKIHEKVAMDLSGYSMSSVLKILKSRNVTTFCKDFFLNLNGSDFRSWDFPHVTYITLSSVPLLKIGEDPGAIIVWGIDKCKRCNKYADSLLIVDSTPFQMHVEGLCSDCLRISRLARAMNGPD